MTYYSSYYYKSYSWSAFTEADLLAGGKNGSSIDCGDSFVVGKPTTKMSTKDNDSKLSGDDKIWWAKDYSDDRKGQDAYVNNSAVGSKMYAEQYHVLKGSDGKIYYMIEIKVEGHDSAGAGNGYFTFYGKQPPVGTSVTVVSTKNVAGSWVDYSCLGAGETAPPNTPPKFTNVPSNGIYCVDENNKLVVDLNASDKDGDALSFSIVGGADGAAFTIDADTGVLSFVNAPDYENPTDKDGNNSYKVIVAVSDGKGGVTNKELTVNVKDVKESGGTQDCIVVEAEDMNLSCYRVKGASSASGNEYISLTGYNGSAATKFTGDAGEYDFSVRYWDAARGDGYIKVLVNGKAVQTIRLNAENNKWSEVTINDLDLKYGDVITLKGYGKGCEYAIIDKIKFCPTEPEVEPGALEGRVFVDANKDGIDNNETGVSGVTVQLLNAAGVVVATQATAADGSYRFGDLEPGEYSVVFPTEVDGMELTDANVGSDDTVDSDANVTTGATGSYTVETGETVPNVDAGLYVPNEGPVAADDAGKTCVSEQETVNVLANDSDADGDDLTVTAVNGQAISDGESVTLDDGVVVSLSAGQLVFDASASDYASLTIGESGSATYSYTISDGNGGFDTANIDMDYCGSLNTLETIAASLPEGGNLTLARDQVGDTFYNATITGTGDERFDGQTFDIVYCVSAAETINFGVTIPVSIHLADADTLPAGTVPNPQNLDMVNWILNQDFSAMDNGDGTGETYTEAEIQGAIWGLTDNIVFVNENVSAYGTTANAQEIYDLALTNGEGFEAGEGDIVGLIFDPVSPAANPNTQPLIIGVNWDDLAQDCLCG